MMDDKNRFNYIYSSNKYEHIKDIRDKYIEKKDDTFSYLYKLDQSVTNKSTICALIFGIVGIFVLGFGMSLVMTDLGNNIGISNNQMCIGIGIIIGILGIIFCFLAYPTYCFVLKKQRKKIAPKIIEITDKLLKK